MVNWTKRAEKAAEGLLQPGEQVQAGVNLTGRQFRVVGGGSTGGFIAGGLVGALVGHAWDKHLEGRRTADAASRSKDPIEELPVRDVDFPSNGAVAAMTNRPLILFETPGTRKPRRVFYDVSVGDIADVYERELEQKLMQGTPASRVMLIVFEDDTALPLYALNSGVSRKWVDGFVSALRRYAVLV